MWRKSVTSCFTIGIQDYFPRRCTSPYLLTHQPGEDLASFARNKAKPRNCGGVSVPRGTRLLGGRRPRRKKQISSRKDAVGLGKAILLQIHTRRPLTPMVSKVLVGHRPRLPRAAVDFPQPSGTKQQNLFHHHSEARVKNQSVGRGTVPPKALGENLLLTSPGFWKLLAPPGWRLPPCTLPCWPHGLPSASVNSPPASVC